MEQKNDGLLPCFCGRPPIRGMAKKTSCQMHGEPSQAVTLHCRPDCFARPFVSAGDVYNGGKEKAYQEAEKIWNDNMAKYTRPTPPAAQISGMVGEDHPDDAAVDKFAEEMKKKLAKKRKEGRGGWEDKSQCTADFLSELLRGHVEKGDPVDVANLAMMLFCRGESIKAEHQVNESELMTVLTGATMDDMEPLLVTAEIIEVIETLRRNGLRIVKDKA